MPDRVSILGLMETVLPAQQLDAVTLDCNTKRSGGTCLHTAAAVARATRTVASYRAFTLSQTLCHGLCHNVLRSWKDDEGKLLSKGSG